MGTLLQTKTGRRVALDGRQIVGRSSKCGLRLPHPSVSGEHAVIWWAQDAWYIRDLHSRNGTFLGEHRLAPEAAQRLDVGTPLRFGEHPLLWELASDGAPLARAEGADGRVAQGEEGLLLLPDAHAPQALIYVDASSGWVAEVEDTVRPVRDQELLEVDGHAWRLHLPDVLARTEAARAEQLRLADLTLRFEISADEEHVQLSAETPLRVLDLGTRAHNYTLLTLARARARDAAAGELPEAEQGWVYQEELARMLRLDRGQLNLHVFRARKQLQSLEVEDAKELVERRLDSQQLRLGVGRLALD